MQPPTPPEAAKDIELLKGLVARHFPVYDVRVNFDVVEFFCRVDDTTLEEKFEQLREEMGKQGFIPMITYEKGEHVVIVGRKPDSKYRSIYVNLAMLIITFLTMTLAGVLDWGAYADVPSNETFSAKNILTGIAVFALPLMAILGVHELGHFFMARRRKVAASMPFFIPSFPPLGTFGAFISLRDPIPNRKTLLEIGIAGPIAGLLVAIPIGIAGLMLTNAEARPVPETIGEGSLALVMFPMIYNWLGSLVPIQGDYLLHPMAFAAWVGFLVTALNLLPAGQLDGGHISRALLGNKAKYASWVTIAALLALSMFYFSWIIFAILILFLGAKHPPPLNDITKLKFKHKALGVLAFVILIIAFVPVPMVTVMPDYSFDATPADGTTGNVTPGVAVHFEVFVENLGNTRNNITFSDSSSLDGWNISFKPSTEGEDAYTAPYTVSLRTDRNASVDVLVRSAMGAAPGNQTVNITLHPEGLGDDGSSDVTISYDLVVLPPVVTFSLAPDTLSIPLGGEDATGITIDNAGEGDIRVSLMVTQLDTYLGAVIYLVGMPEVNSSSAIEFTVPAGTAVDVGLDILVWSTATVGTKTIEVEAYCGDILLETLIMTVQVY
jgi:Zn-dependent protease